MLSGHDAQFDKQPGCDGTLRWISPQNFGCVNAKHGSISLGQHQRFRLIDINNFAGLTSTISLD
jgi:hypothetical protein